MIRLIRIFANIFLCFIVRAYHKIEKMTEKELKAQQQYLLNLKIIERKTKKPLIFWINRPCRFRQDLSCQRIGPINRCYYR